MALSHFVGTIKDQGTKEIAYETRDQRQWKKNQEQALVVFRLT
jgi:hypothetical protein